MKNAPFLLMCLLAAATMSRLPAESPKGSIEGKVVDAKTNAPVKKAAVTMQGGMLFRTVGQTPSQTLPFTALTDAEGNFAFHDVEAGSYQIQVQHQAYPSLPGQSFRALSVFLGRGQTLKGVTVKLTPQAVIAGRVLDEDGAPVQGAQVSVLRRDESRRGGGLWASAGWAQTDDIGEYRVARLAAGSYLVRATWRENGPTMYYRNQPLPSGPESAYVPTHYPSATNADAAKVVTVEMGAEVRGIDIRLQKARTVRLRGHVEGMPAVTDGTGRTMPWITLIPRSGTRFDFSSGSTPATMSFDGTFEIRGVVPGAYLLVAQSQPNTMPAVAAAQPIEVSDKPIEGIVLRLSATRDVEGTVTFAEKTPVALGNASVRFSVQASWQGRNQQAAHIADRQFALKDVPPLPATVEVNNLPQTCYVKEVRYGGRPVPPQGVVLTTGEQLEIVVSTAMAELAGMVTDAGGKAVRGSVVTLMAEDAGAWPRQTNTQSGGTFTFHVKPGEYQAVAWEAMDMNLLTPEFLKRFPGRTTPVKLAPGTNEIVKLTMVSLEDIRKLGGVSEPERPLGGIAGTVVDAKSGAPVKGASVTYSSRTGGYAFGLRRMRPPDSLPEVETDEQGRFSIADLEPGAYRLSAKCRGCAVSGPQTENPEDYTVVGDGQQIRGVLLKMEPQAVITGKILGDDGEPLMHASITAYHKIERREGPPWRMASGAQTDDRGEFRIAGLEPGSYLLRAVYRSRHARPAISEAFPDAPDMTYAPQFYPDAADTTTAKPVKVAAGAEVAGIDMKLHREATVRVRGTLTGEEPGGRYAPRLVPRKPGSAFPADEPIAIRGPEGAFEFYGIRPGSYYLVAGNFQSPSFAVQPIEIAGKHIDGVTVNLVSHHEVSVTLKFENGIPPVFLSLVPSINALPRIYQNVMPGDTTVTLPNVAPIPYTLGDNLQPDYYWKSITYGGQPVVNRTIDFGAPGPLEITVSSGAAQVEGSVVDAQDKPVSLAAIALAPMSGSSAAVRTGTSDAQGKFYFASLAPGDYRVVAWAGAPPDKIDDLEFVRNFSGTYAPLSVVAHDRRTIRVTANATEAR